MTLELALYIGLLLHILGDYILQNNWMAQNKIKFDFDGYLACWTHATIYALPFIIICPNVIGWAIIYSTHFFIDKYDAAKYWIMFVNWSWGEPNYGFGKKMPPTLAIVLKIIIDNFFHVVINSIVIYYTFSN